MKLDEIMESLVSSVKKYGSTMPIFKNPTPDELKQVMSHGVVRCVITQTNVYVFDWNKLSYDEIPKLNGIRANLFFNGPSALDVEVSSFNDVKEGEAEEMVKNNKFLQQFNIGKVIITKPDKTD